MFRELWNERYRAALGSKNWFKYWCKRIYLGPSLWRSVMKRRFITGRGGKVGKFSVTLGLVAEGSLDNLKIGQLTSIGQVKIQLHDRVDIGSNVVINDHCQLLTGTHNVQSPDWELLVRPIKIEDFVWIATSSIILPGVVVGYGAVVGAGAVVTRSVAPFSIVAGNPAKPIGIRKQEDFNYQPTRFTALYEAWLGPITLDGD